jgi:hypothetical protein
MQIPNITQSTGLLMENGIEQIDEEVRMAIMVDEDFNCLSSVTHSHNAS